MAVTPGRRTTSAIALDELRRRDDLESLRKFLVAEQCFPAHKEPETAPITMEELKKLARIWKLNERRNFWKNHAERNEMVAALLQHAEQDQKFINKKVKTERKTNAVEYKATPPTDLKPSLTRRNVDQMLKMRNYCGIKYFNRVPESDELVIQSRFFDFPDAESNVDHVVDSWRGEDFHLKDDSLLLGDGSSFSADGTALSEDERQPSVRASAAGSKHTVAGIKNKVKLVKHRNLATHLMNYSAAPDLQLHTLTMKTVQTFVNVADTEDHKTVSTCMIAISNIASSDHVRALLFEINALHKVTNMLQYIRGKAAMRAAGLLFYYFSCDSDTEDRVYNSCSTFLQANGLAKDVETRMLALYTLNNLMPCIDRQRVADITLRTIHANFDPAVTLHDKSVLNAYLSVMLNMCCYTNAHSTLLGLDILTLLAIIANFAVKEKNEEIALMVSKILQSFLQAAEQAASLITGGYVEVLLILIKGMPQDAVLVHCMKVTTLLSGIQALKPLLHEETRTVQVVSEMVLHRGDVTSSLAKETSKFFVNMTISETAAHLEMAVASSMAEAMLAILTADAISNSVKAITAVALQNVLSVHANAVKLAATCFNPLIKFLGRMTSCHSAALALYNISCAPQCRAAMVESQIHIKILQFLISAKELEMKSAFLQTLVQMSGSNVCVLQLLGVDLVQTLEAQLKRSSTTEVWSDISLLLLAVVAFASDDLKQQDQVSIIRILKTICVEGTKTDVIENCANVLKYISVRYAEFVELHPVVQSLLELSDREEVVEGVSNVLYNMTCFPTNIAQMLTNHHYVNSMIHIMRSSKLEVQENIAQALRNLCTDPRCTDILLKKDILSDMIVIALLRTSSEEIKVVCSEAFYNMLCHPATRLQLLKGDLWWAIMRLCRTDSHDVRSNCAKALFDLSTDGVNVAPLRTHHVLSFVKDIISSGNQHFLQMCLRSVHNLIRQFADPEFEFFDIIGHEVVSAIRIATELLPQMEELEYARACIGLLLKCAQQKEIEETAAEFVRLYVVEVLFETRKTWSRDRACRIYVSRLLWELCQHDVFTKSCHLSDVDEVCCAAYASNPPFEVLDNIVATLLQVVVREDIAPDVLIAMKMWRLVLMEALSVESVVLQQHKKTVAALNASSVFAENVSAAAGRKLRGTEIVRPSPPAAASAAAAASLSSVADIGSPRGKLLRERSITTMGASGGNGNPVMRALESRIQDTRSSVLALLAHCIEALIASSPDTITRSLVLGICSRELIDHSQSRNNLLLVLSALSEHQTYAGYLLDGQVFKLLVRYVTNTIGTSKLDKAQEFSAGLLHNLSLHSNLVARVVSIADGSLSELVREVLEGTTNLSVQLYISVFFFHSASFLMKSEQALNPKFVLDCIAKMPHMEQDTIGAGAAAVTTSTAVAAAAGGRSGGGGGGSSSGGAAVVTVNWDLCAVNKYTISMILNKYKFGAGVNPNYVQYMFTYITQQNQNSSVPSYIDRDSFRRLENLVSSFPTEVLSRKESEEIELENYGADETLWQPTGSSETKRHNTIILKFSEPSPVLNAETQTCDASTFFVFSKIKKEFAALRERLDGGENSAIAEANEEEEEDEDNDDDDDGEGDGAEGEGANGGDDASIFSQSTNASLGQQSTGTKRTEASSSSKPASASAGIAAIGEEMEEGKTDSAAEAPSVAAAAGADISDTRDEPIERSGTDSRRTSPVPSSRKHAQSPTPSAHKGSHSPLGSSSASFRNAGAASPARSGSGSGSRGRTARGDSQRQVSAQELPAAAATVATEAEELGQSAAGPAEDAASSKGEKDKQAGNGEDDEDFLAYSNNFDDEQD